MLEVNPDGGFNATSAFIVLIYKSMFLNLEENKSIENKCLLIDVVHSIFIQERKDAGMLMLMICTACKLCLCLPSNINAINFQCLSHVFNFVFSVYI